jgi:D-alanyl-D-alanine dipeptidase
MLPAPWLLLLALAEPVPDVTLPGLIDVGAALPVKVELKYATTDNFTGQNLYGGLRRCFLVRDASDMLARAHQLLAERDANVTFIMYDCARPRSVQLKMWDVVKGTPKQGYVANPHQPPGSVHNTGCAVDLSLVDKRTGVPLDMGTPYDFFGPAAEPRREADLFKEGKVTNEQLANRLLLREVMIRAGFRLLPHEWWHFDCKPGAQARKLYPLIE